LPNKQVSVDSLPYVCTCTYNT